MPRRRGMRRTHANYVDLADLVMRNSINHRHHPYNFRPTTLRRQPGSMNERVLWRNQINPPPPDYDENNILQQLSTSSRSRLYMNTINQVIASCAPPEVQEKATKTAQRLNRMATAFIVTPPKETSDTKNQNQFHVDDTKSTVILHHNPLFDAEGAKRSGLLFKKPSSKDAHKKTSAKKKRASPKVFSGSKQSSLTSTSAVRKNRIDRAKREMVASSSFACSRECTRVASKKKSPARIKSEQLDDDDVDGSGVAKDQELAPPPPSPLFPNVQTPNCSTLAAILESVDNFLRNVKKS